MRFFSLSRFFVSFMRFAGGGSVFIKLHWMGAIHSGLLFCRLDFFLSMRLLELDTLWLIVTFLLACIVVLGCRMGYRYGLYLFCFFAPLPAWNGLTINILGRESLLT